MTEKFLFVKLCYNISQDVKLQTAGGNQDELDCTPHLMPEALQIVRMDENCAQQAGEISNGPVENTVLHDPEVQTITSLIFILSYILSRVA